MVDNKKLKDELMQKTAEDSNQSLSVVRDVMSWMFRDVTKALKTHQEVELSGFGAFQLSQAKLKRRIVRMEEIKQRLEAKPPSEDRELKLDITNRNLEYFYSKLINKQQPIENAVEENMGGVEEQAHSLSTDEGRDSQNSGGASGDMQAMS